MVFIHRCMRGETTRQGTNSRAIGTRIYRLPDRPATAVVMVKSWENSKTPTHTGRHWIIVYQMNTKCAVYGNTVGLFFFFFFFASPLLIHVYGCWYVYLLAHEVFEWLNRVIYNTSSCCTCYCECDKSMHVYDQSNGYFFRWVSLSQVPSF